MVRRLVITGLISGWLWLLAPPNNPPNVTFLNVGQGLAVLFEDGHGWQLLFDSGPDNTVLNEIGKSMSPADNRLDLVVISHQHADHYTGAIELLRRYQVGELWVGRADNNSVAWQELITTAKERGTPLLEVKEGKVLYLNSGYQIKVLHPPTQASGQHAHDYNVVLSISRTATELILTGDAESPHESYIARCQTSLFWQCPSKGAILQISHHGSNTSTSLNWLNLLQPSQAVISVGPENSYGHPHQNIIERLKQNHIPYFRTDEQGTIKLDLNK